jgi:hypothetical protein
VSTEVDAEAGAAAVETHMAGDESAATGRTVEIPPQPT